MRWRLSLMLLLHSFVWLLVPANAVRLKFDTETLDLHERNPRKRKADDLGRGAAVNVSPLKKRKVAAGAFSRAQLDDPVIVHVLDVITEDWRRLVSSHECDAPLDADVEFTAVGAQIQTVQGYNVRLDVEVVSPSTGLAQMHRFFAEVSLFMAVGCEVEDGVPETTNVSKRCSRPPIFFKWPVDPCSLLTQSNDINMTRTSLLQRLQLDQPLPPGSRPSQFLPSDAEMEQVLGRAMPLKEEFDPRHDTDRGWKQCFPGRHGEKTVLSQGNCGSCWVFAGLGSFADRLCIANPESMIHQSARTRFFLSHQQLLSCHKEKTLCNGGRPEYFHNYLVAPQQGLTLEHDYPYASRCVKPKDEQRTVVEPFLNPAGCKPYEKLPEHSPLKPCACVKHGSLDVPQCDTSLTTNGDYHIRRLIKLPSYFRFGQERSNQVIMGYLYDSGPAYAEFTVWSDFQDKMRLQSGNEDYVYSHDVADATEQGRHAVSMLGWGVSRDRDRLPYWNLRNSWGTEWGHQGHFKMARGTNECGIEDDVYVGVVWQHAKKWGLQTRLSRSLTGSGDLVLNYYDLGMTRTDCFGVSATAEVADSDRFAEEFESVLESMDCCCLKASSAGSKCRIMPSQMNLSSPQLQSCGIRNVGNGFVHTSREDWSKCAEHQKQLANARKLPLPMSSLPSNYSDHTVLRINYAALGPRKNQPWTVIEARISSSGISIDDNEDSRMVSNDLKLSSVETSISIAFKVMQDGRFMTKRLFSISAVELTFTRRNNLIAGLEVVAKCSHDCVDSGAVLKCESASSTLPSAKKALQFKGTLGGAELMWQLADLKALSTYECDLHVRAVATSPVPLLGSLKGDAPPSKKLNELPAEWIERVQLSEMS